MLNILTMFDKCSFPSEEKGLPLKSLEFYKSHTVNSTLSKNGLPRKWKSLTYNRFIMYVLVKKKIVAISSIRHSVPNGHGWNVPCHSVSGRILQCFHGIWRQTFTSKPPIGFMGFSALGHAFTLIN